MTTEERIKKLERIIKSGIILILGVFIIGVIVTVLILTGVIGGYKEDHEITVLFGGISTPQEVSNRPMEVIDVETLETLEVTVGDFVEKFHVDPDTGYRINSDGTKIAEPTSCMSCGELIPPPPTPRDIEPEERERIIREYECPKCGEKAYGDE